AGSAEAARAVRLSGQRARAGECHRAGGDAGRRQVDRGRRPAACVLAGAPAAGRTLGRRGSRFVDARAGGARSHRARARAPSWQFGARRPSAWYFSYHIVAKAASRARRSSYLEEEDQLEEAALFEGRAWKGVRPYYDDPYTTKFSASVTGRRTDERGT